MDHQTTYRWARYPFTKECLTCHTYGATRRPGTTTTQVCHYCQGAGYEYFTAPRRFPADAELPAGWHWTQPGNP
ncbi:hypothetical protein SAMN05421505_1201 [Sinosporangium album]|uniref:Uncharacterized protein n=1 Tax=Sinosporangium album TaxID=504805 RepID=A0A1G8E9I0_9ACTN|nr:hypothetical protein [Sinosporangium album]SDH66602.1 hypothetical protein SAMN05421505_1201 [Sinosporangium album]